MTGTGSRNTAQQQPLPVPLAGNRNRGGRNRLLASLVCVAVVWLIILPAAGRSHALRTAMDARARQGIDSAAMFYTDLDLMDDVLARTAAFHRKHPNALWQPPPADR